VSAAADTRVHRADDGAKAPFRVKRGPGELMRTVAVAVLLAPIRLYQRFLSPALPRRCKYEPTCSAYAVEAIRDVGPLRGLILASWRLLRCNPLSDGGLDPVSERRMFRDRGAEGSS